MTELLYLNDSYLKECDSSIIEANGKEVVLDRTVFYPRGGGQPTDTGRLAAGGVEYAVKGVSKKEGKIVHEMDKDGLKAGDAVHCVLNWERRYKLMRSHTAAHLLSSVMNREGGVLITGNQLEEDKVRFDFNLLNFDREFMERCVAKTNEILKTDAAIDIYTLPREEAMKLPGIIKLAGALPPNINELRIVEIRGYDVQADGGTHVKNLAEVGQIELLKLENKGKENRRIYFAIRP